MIEGGLSAEARNGWKDGNSRRTRLNVSERSDNGIVFEIEGRIDMKYFALIYYVVDGYVSRRTPFREKHLRRAEDAHRRGDLVLAGALGDPIDRALLIFRGQDRSVVEAFARNDPYVINGLVTRWEVQPWAVVIDGNSATIQGGAV